MQSYLGAEQRVIGLFVEQNACQGEGSAFKEGRGLGAAISHKTKSTDAKQDGDRLQ